jgi:hypothetical protein
MQHTRKFTIKINFRHETLYLADWPVDDNKTIAQILQEIGIPQNNVRHLLIERSMVSAEKIDTPLSTLCPISSNQEKSATLNVFLSQPIVHFFNKPEKDSKSIIINIVHENHLLKSYSICVDNEKTISQVLQEIGLLKKDIKHMLYENLKIDPTELDKPFAVLFPYSFNQAREEPSILYFCLSDTLSIPLSYTPPTIAPLPIPFDYTVSAAKPTSSFSSYFQWAYNFFSHRQKQPIFIICEPEEEEEANLMPPASNEPLPEHDDMFIICTPEEEKEMDIALSANLPSATSSVDATLPAPVTNSADAALPANLPSATNSIENNTPPQPASAVKEVISVIQAETCNLYGKISAGLTNTIQWVPNFFSKSKSPLDAGTQSPEPENKPPSPPRRFILF